MVKKESWDIGHRIAKVKDQIHQISRNIAIWMFENNSSKVEISQESSMKDFLIGNYLKMWKTADGETHISFLYQSIYEYFVDETIFDSIEDDLKELSEESQKRFAKSIVTYLEEGTLTYNIVEYIKYKIDKLYTT